MQPRLSRQRTAALTLVEVLVVLVMVAILFLLTIPATTHDRPIPAMRINCISNLKQIGLAYRLWEGDHEDKYPMAVLMANGGAMELVATGNVAVCFQVMSNELSTPKILWCPADTHRVQSTSFSTLNNSSISYLVGLNATNETNTRLLLSGDDNLAIGDVPAKSGPLELSAGNSVVWSSGRHNVYNSHFWTPVRDRFVGNIGLADGSAQTVTTDGLQKALQQTGQATNQLAIP